MKSSGKTYGYPNSPIALALFHFLNNNVVVRLLVVITHEIRLYMRDH